MLWHGLDEYCKRSKRNDANHHRAVGSGSWVRKCREMEDEIHDAFRSKIDRLTGENGTLRRESQEMKLRESLVTAYLKERSDESQS